MRRAIPLLVAVLVAQLFSATLLATPAEAAKLPSKATWEKHNAAIMKGSVTWLRDRIARAEPDEKLAINLDIDNTSLATHYAPGKPVRPTLRLAREADALGVAVLFNTARSPRKLDRATTELRAAGFQVDGICGKPRGVPLAEGKQACRDRFAEEGYTLVVNVGNRTTDFTGDGYEKRYKLRSYGGRLS